MRRKVIWFGLVILLALADQLTKSWAISQFAYGIVHKIVPMFNIQLVYNYGVSFSLFSAATYYYFILAFGLMITAGLMVWLVKMPSQAKLRLSSVTLILGGAVGNLVDRAFRGYVVDFIDFTIGSWHWYNFNLADVWISLGAFLMILDLLMNKEHSEKTEVKHENHTR